MNVFVTSEQSRPHLSFLKRKRLRLFALVLIVATVQVGFSGTSAFAQNIQVTPSALTATVSKGPEHHAHLEFAEDRHHATRVGTQDQCELDQSLAGLWQQQHHHDGTRSGPRHRQYGQPRRGHQFRARLYFRIRPRRLAFHHRTRHRYRHGCRHHPAAAPGVPTASGWRSHTTSASTVPFHQSSHGDVGGQQ